MNKASSSGKQASQQTPSPAKDKTDQPDDNPDMQGEGNYTAARNYRENTEKFVEQGKVDEAAHAAKPDSPQQARELREAEEAGKKPARR